MKRMRMPEPRPRLVRRRDKESADALAPLSALAALRSRMRGESGQATVEYALVGLALMAAIGALAALWHAAAEGDFSGLVEEHASHSVEHPGGMADVLMY